jgi:hypothetical protein
MTAWGAAEVEDREVRLISDAWRFGVVLLDASAKQFRHK